MLKTEKEFVEIYNQLRKDIQSYIPKKHYKTNISDVLEYTDKNGLKFSGIDNIGSFLEYAFLLNSCGLERFTDGVNSKTFFVPAPSLNKREKIYEEGVKRPKGIGKQMTKYILQDLYSAGYVSTGIYDKITLAKKVK